MTQVYIAISEGNHRLVINGPMDLYRQFLATILTAKEIQVDPPALGALTQITPAAPGPDHRPTVTQS